MSEKRVERSAILQGIAAVFNFSGRVMVLGVEKSVDCVNSVASVAKSVSRGSAKVADTVVSGLGLSSGSTLKIIEEQIRECEKHIRTRYYEIGKESAYSQNLEGTLQKESIQQLIADIHEYKNKIQQLKVQMVEIKADKRKIEVSEPKKIKAKPTLTPANREEAGRYLRNAIEKAIKISDFPSTSARVVFRKVAEDLLDEDSEVRILAAAELGKMDNSAAVEVLMATARQDDAELAAEALNSLITLGDRKAVELFKEQAANPKYRVRMACLRGIYKLAGDEEAGPILIAALQDEHPEVRRSAITFLGWKDYIEAGSAMVQCLRDEESNVRKAAVSALANLHDENAVLPLIKVMGDQVLEIREKALEAIRSITGESIVFDIHATGSTLEAAINDCITWWQDKRSGKTASSVEAVSMVETTPLVAEETIVEKTEIEDSCLGCTSE